MSFPFTGTGVAIITPFKEDLSIDFESLENIINHLIKGKVEYLLPLGTTGESVTLSKEEKKEAVDFCIKTVDGRIPVVVGIGGSNTAEVIDCIKAQDYKGISGILSVSPFYNKPSQEGIYQHFKAISEASPVPVILYNVPGRTGSNMSAETTLRLANDFKNIIAIKEASGNLTQITEILINKPEGFEVLSGDDALSFSMLNLGAKGVISVIANSHPLEFSSLVRHCLAANIDQAKAIQFKLFDYMNALFVEGSPGGIKSALSTMGMCENIVRPPLATISPEQENIIKELIAKL